MEQKQIKIRGLQDGDIAFVMSSWLQSYRHDSAFAKRIRSNVFFKFHHVVVERILERAQTYVACDPEDPSVIFGYLVIESYEDRPVVHYAYVKGPFRKMGIGRDLLKASEISLNNSYYSHQTLDSDGITRKHPDMLYCPYLL